MKRLIQFGLLYIVLFALVLSGCSTPKSEMPTVAPEEKSLRVGVLAPLTGPSSASGLEIQHAVEMAFGEIDYKVGPYDIELVWIDSQSDPEIAARAYEDAILTDGIDVGLLNWHSSVAIAVMEITAEHQLPHFFGLAGSDLIAAKIASNPSKYNYWNFKGWPAIDQLAGNYVSAIETAVAAGDWEPALKKAAIIAEDTDWGQSFTRGMKTKLEAAGWDVATIEFVALDATEFTAALQQMKDAEVQLVVTSGTAADFYPALLKQANNISFNAIVIADGLGWSGSWYETTGSSSDYVLDQIPGWTTAEAGLFVTAYETQWGSQPSPSAAGLSYDYSRFFMQILEQSYAESGVLDRETLYEAGQMHVATGEWSFTEGIVMAEYQYTAETVPNPVVGESHYTFPVLQYQAGNSYIIWPPQWQERPFTAKP